jgi:hypothetical protein
LKIKVLGKPKICKTEIMKEANDIDDAYERGYFGSGMPFDEFCDRIMKKNPEIRIHRGPKYTGLFDTENNYYICGISRFSRIPRFTIVKHDFSQDKTLNYSDEYGNITSKQVINKDEEKGKVLARSWISTFNILKGQGYEVNDEDIDY